jgi:hypothetical protein
MKNAATKAQDTDAKPYVPTPPWPGVPGPVIPKKGKRTANSGSFVKGHKRGGRPRGVPNRFTGELREAILAGVNGSNKQGVAGFVLDLSLDTPTSAAALLGRLIPVSMLGTLDGTIVVVHRDETAADEPVPAPSLGSQDH